jgi:hypothetical protein
MAYNLWADKHLKLNLFSSSIYSQQTAWYPTVERKRPCVWISDKYSMKL